MTQAHFHAFLDEPAEHLQPGDRVCYRDFGVLHGLPSGIEGRVKRLDSLCDEGEAGDASVFFRTEIVEAG